MRKNRTKRTPREAEFVSGSSAGTSASRLPGLLLDARMALRELVLSAGFEVFTQPSVPTYVRH